MKKISIALVGALIICMLLAALFPSAFLTDDAWWTYQNDLGRIDVTFAGNAHNGQIDVTGKDLQLDRPRFYLDNKGNQGVVAHVPVSYVTKDYQITLKPRGNAKEISLALRFRGKNFLVRNQRKPAYVRFENIRVNGEQVAEEKTVWHDQSFWYHAKNISDNSKVTMDFDIRKPFSFADIQWERAIVFFALCSLLLFFSYGTIRKLVRSIIEWKRVMLCDVGRELRLHKQKILILIILTLLTNVLCIPLWTELGYGGSTRTLFNKEVQFDLLYTGKITRAEPFQYTVTPKPSYASWMYQLDNIHQAHLRWRARGKWQKFSLQLKARRDGKITMLFRGPDVRDEYGSFYPVLTDWRNIKINGTVLFDKTKALSFQKCFSKQIPVKENETLNIEGEFRRHHFTTRDFTFLKSGKIWYFITGNLLFFFLLLRLFAALAKRHRRIGLSDTLLLFAFFFCLFIPMMNISDGVRSVRENRMLAEKPKLGEILKEGVNTGGGYEKWFNDHFCGRVSLIKLHDVLRNELSYVIRTKKYIYFKGNGWAFRCPPMVPLFALDCSPVSLQSIVQNIVQLNKFCQQNQIKFYVLEVPHKELIYEKFIKELGYDENKVTKVSQALDFVRNEARKHQIPYIYPYKELCDAAQQNFVFFKWSHHWTDWGAFVGYRALMKEINKDFPDMPVVSLKDYQKYRSCLMRDDVLENFAPPELYLLANLNYSGDFRISYDYYDHKNGDEMVFKYGRRSKDFFYPKGKRKIMLVGRSMNENLSHFLPWSAAEVKYIRLNNGRLKTADWFKVLKLYKSDIQDFKPDIFILSITTDDLPQLRDLCSTK